MAQELRVGGNEVLLSLSPEYRTTDDSADAVPTLLGAVQRFKPFVDYLTAFKAPAECDLSTVVVKNVGQIGQRVSSVTCDVTLRHAKTGKVESQPVHLDSDLVPCVVLPVIDVAAEEGERASAAGTFAVLFPRPRLALGSQSVLDAPLGYFDNSRNNNNSDSSSNKKATSETLQITNSIDLEDLAAAGFSATHLTERMCTPLASEDIVTGYEGQVPIRVLASKRSCTAADLEKLMARCAPSNGGGERPPFVIVPLEDVAARTTDIHAILAASLLL